MPIHYIRNQALATEDVMRVFKASAIRRPSEDAARIATMFANANLVIAAWDADRLVGVCRALSDFSYCCYVSDLAVDLAYQRQGIGRALLDEVKDAIGEQVSIFLVASETSDSYYSTLGFQALQRGYVMPRKH